MITETAHPGSTDLSAIIENGGTVAEAIFEDDKASVMGTYARLPIVVERGSDVYLWDTEGRQYLDFLGGIAVVSVGHAHPAVSEAIANQARRLVHVSNLFHNLLQSKLAKRLNDLTGMDRVFFCNSGAEANEAAIKIARKWGKQRRGEACHEIITFNGSFHGRTLATVTATAQPKYQAPFTPLVPGFHYTPLNNLIKVDELISENTCAVMVEPIQGESGINVATPSFLAGLRALCDEADVLLIFDEVQCGMGRTGSFLASQQSEVVPDIVTLAKGIANGFPMGACLAKGAAATTLVPGDHGSTFAGQPLACAASLATLDVLVEGALMANATEVGRYFMVQLSHLRDRDRLPIREVRGAGLMIGVELLEPVARTISRNLLEMGIIVNAASDSTLRFLPPLTVTMSHCDQVVHALRSLLASTSD